MPNSISQTPATTVVIYCGNQVLSAPRGGFAAGAGASKMRQGQIGSGEQGQKSLGTPRKARFSNATAEEQIQASYTWTKPLAPNCGAPSVRSAAAFATGRKSARSRRHVSDMRQHSPLTTIP